MRPICNVEWNEIETRYQKAKKNLENFKIMASSAEEYSRL